MRFCGPLQSLKEKWIMEELDHPNLVKILGSFPIKGHAVGIAMELCDGSLAELITSDRKLARWEIAKLMRDMHRGLEYIHKQQIIHR